MQPYKNDDLAADARCGRFRSKPPIHQRNNGPLREIKRNRHLFAPGRCRLGNHPEANPISLHFKGKGLAT